MKISILFAAILIMSTQNAHAAETDLKAPDVEKKPHTVKAPFGTERQDEYYWLRDDKRENKAMLDYLNAENAYVDQVMKPLKPLEDKLYDETVARIKQDENSVPARTRGWWYYSRFEQGKDYPIYARRKDRAGANAETMYAASQKPDADEVILLNVNTLAQGKDYYQIGSYEISQDNKLLAYAEDTNGRRQHVIRFKNIETGDVYPDQIPAASGSMAWADDNKTLFYTENDAKTLLTKKIKKHVLGTPVAQDVVVYEEPDDSFYMGVGRTTDDRFICIQVSSTVSDEVRCTEARHPGEFKVLAKRERDVQYDADHLGDRWVIRTNAPDKHGKVATNFKLMTAPTTATSREQWQDLVPHRDDVLVESFELFDTFVAVTERSNALKRIRVLRNNGKDSFIETDEPAYFMSPASNTEHDTPWMRYVYTSMTTPATTYETNVDTGERRLLKQQPVLGDFKSDNYVTERVWVTARDGAKVPVSLVYRKGFKKDGTAPMLQYAYGSYGMPMDPSFSITNLSLLDRGVVYAIAHIRGGQEMGRKWYEDGKLLKKKNTFNDFIDVTDALVKQGYAAPDRVAAYGGSAGGLLMGAISNMAPDKYRVILSQVPFVDVTTTMLDPSIPLTTNEYDEWGNPEKKEFYDYIVTYSPYDNLKAQAYPAMFIGTGLWDSQVQYWEPAKYVARLRDLNTSKNTIVFRTNMEAGHGGKSGRFRQYRERAEMYAFMLDQLGVKEN